MINTMYAQVTGGGLSGQAGAVRHGIARALLQVDPEFRTVLEAGGLPHPDPRVKERRKYGLKKPVKLPNSPSGKYPILEARNEEGSSPLAAGDLLWAGAESITCFQREYVGLKRTKNSRKPVALRHRLPAIEG